ncbi:sigma factor [Candidatus Poribacteria bacterium]
MLVDKYREGIYAFVYAKLRNFQDAQDVTQEVFLHAYRNLRTLWLPDAASYGFGLRQDVLTGTSSRIRLRR